jgi:hypothetical protein
MQTQKIEKYSEDSKSVFVFSLASVVAEKQPFFPKRKFKNSTDKCDAN